MNKIIYYLGLGLMVTGLILAVPPVLQIVHFYSSISSADSTTIYNPHEDSNLTTDYTPIINFVIGACLVNFGWLLFKLTYENGFGYIDNKRIVTNMDSRDIRNINMGTQSTYNEDVDIEGDYKPEYKYLSEENQTLVQAAAEIQTLLEKLGEMFPTKTTSDIMVVAAKAVEQIEHNPTFKQRTMNAAKEGGLAAFERAIDNPAGAFVINAVRGWQEGR